MKVGRGIEKSRDEGTSKRMDEEDWNRLVQSSLLGLCVLYGTSARQNRNP